MPDLHYTDPRLVQLYDLENGLRSDHAFYLSLAGPAPLRILDLGCGTGALCNDYAALGHLVTGIDPAPAMLDAARAKPFGAGITWVNTSAATFRSARHFDLIVMTGHAFQHLLGDADIKAILGVMRGHLAPDGTVAFETRNPAVDWSRRWHGQIAEVIHDGQTIKITRSVMNATPDQISFATDYALPGGVATWYSTLHFPTLATLTPLFTTAGLQQKACYGDWAGGAFDPSISEEMIFLLQPA
jgi:2-polyprenyl-3-methyl-5-hydroxy-6-metoxy-1,4-benzoquinol methylase